LADDFDVTQVKPCNPLLREGPIRRALELTFIAIAIAVNAAQSQKAASTCVTHLLF
jgi:hypothetical protein